MAGILDYLNWRGDLTMPSVAVDIVLGVKE